LDTPAAVSALTCVRTLVYEINLLWAENISSGRHDRKRRLGVAT
jgi:hypothetical protein